MTEPTYSNRSISVVEAITKGYKLYMDNFRKFVKASWTTALFFAVATSCLSVAYVYQSPVLSVVGSVAYYLLLIAMMALCFGMLKEHLSTGEIAKPKSFFGRFNLMMYHRTFVAMILTTILLFLLGGIVGLFVYLMNPLGLLIATIVSGIIGTLGIVLLIPFMFSFFHYILDDRSTLSSYFKNYRGGLHYYGRLFGIILLTSIIIGIATLILQLPELILAAANVSSQMGVMAGDPAGMPESMMWWGPVVFAFSGFIQAYLHLFILFPIYVLLFQSKTKIAS